MFLEVIVFLVWSVASSMLGIYLGAYEAYHLNYKIVYQDINGKRDLSGDMLDIDLTGYDFIICTPPCNWWSKANWRKNFSEYSLKTRCLLPIMIMRLAKLGKPFIIENVRNKNAFKEFGLFDMGVNYYFIGRHTYWSNIDLSNSGIIQKPIIEYDSNGNKKYMSSQNLGSKDRQGGTEVHEVVEYFLKLVYFQED